MTILFVCTGNTCRSPLAMFMLRSLLADRQIRPEQCRAESAGLAVTPGQHMSQPAVACLPESVQPQALAYEAQQIDARRLSAADWVFCMTKQQSAWLKQAAAALAPRIMTLGQAAAICCRKLTASGKLPQEIAVQTTTCGQYGRDIPDPYGRSAEVYQSTARLIRQDLLLIVTYMAVYGDLMLD
ncbi:MAG: hypothetical protein PHR21_04370 [Oscillospiraceae bacterium]|nr:hypothetical protein [Oscillospiraceae bacterium]MDD4369152.1 hypothetical protein [Oscillospiraceae bacterium]